MRGGSQFVMATHSPLLLAFPGATILSLDGGAIEAVPYEQMEHFQVTRRFLMDHQRALAELLEEDGDADE